MTELNVLLKEWYGTLAELTRVYGSLNEAYRKNLSARTNSIRALSSEYRESLGTPVLYPASYGKHSGPKHAVAAGKKALERLDGLVVIAGQVEYPEGGNRADFYTLRNKLNLRWQKLFELRKELRAVDLHRTEMLRTVPKEFYCALLRVDASKIVYARDLQPVEPAEAAAVIELYAADIPAGYATGALGRENLAPENARLVIEMYRDGVSAEFASVMV